MKKELTLGTRPVPATSEHPVLRICKKLNGILPADCQVRNERDAWHLASVASLCLTFIFPPCVLMLAACIVKVRRLRAPYATTTSR